MDLNDIYGYKQARKISRILGFCLLPMPFIFLLIGFVFLIFAFTTNNSGWNSPFQIISVTFVAVGFFEAVLFTSLYFGIKRAVFKKVTVYKNREG